MDIFNKIQSLIMRGVQKLKCDETKLQQQAQCEFLGQTQDVASIMPYGFYTSPPVGSEWLIFSVRGNSSDRVGFANDFKNRPKNLQEGDVYLVNLKTGDYINILTNGSINIVSKQTLNVTAPNMNLTGTINLTGSLVATGEVTANGIALSTHTHSGVTAGTGNTGQPNP